MKKLILTAVLLSTLTFTFAQQPLKVLVIFAHPDEGEIYAGGVTALYTQMGHKVKFMALTNGDAGHFFMKPEELAKRRYKEAMNAKEILGLAEYEILDHHDGILKNGKEVRQQVVKSITDWMADIVFTFYPAKGGHNDNMTAGWIVREASQQLDQDNKPVFIYIRDYHTANFSYIPDIAINIDEVWETKLASCAAHASQTEEANPYAEGVLEEVKASEKKRDEFLFHNSIPWSIARPDNIMALEKWYGREVAQNTTFIEEYEIAEFGRQINDREVYRLFPMLGKTFTLSAKAEWFDTGIDLKEGQTVDLEATGKILYNLENKLFCDPDGAIPYSNRKGNPVSGVGTGAVIGKIGKDSKARFVVGKKRQIKASSSGRLFLGINDIDTEDNEGNFRVRIDVQ